MLYDKSPDNSNKRLDWSKGIVKDIEGPGHKYTIENDNGRNVTRTRWDIRPDGLYVTQSGRVSRPPDHLIVKYKSIVHSSFCRKDEKLSRNT